jgi:F420-dependent oxidoreductase-like protein
MIAPQGGRRLRIGVQIDAAAGPRGAVALAQEAERLGFDSVWTSESYGTDAVTVLSWIGASTTKIKLGTAIMQISARSPALTASTVAGLDELSGGRVILGLGTSGPQVVEGWHGAPWLPPIRSTREYVEIVRSALLREGPLTYAGEVFNVPYAGVGATGLGKPLKLMRRPLRGDVPVYTAAMGPRNVALAAEIADGWLPTFFSPRHFDGVFKPSLEEGFARRGGDRSVDFDISPLVQVVVGQDRESCREPVRQRIALYMGGMGAPGRNFYNDLAARYGFADAAAEIQQRFLAGDRQGATAAVPSDLVDSVAIAGPPDHVERQLRTFRDSGVRSLVCQTSDMAALRVIADASGSLNAGDG